MNKYKDALNELFVYSKHSANKVEILSLTECYEKLEQLINEHFELKEKYEKLVDKATHKKGVLSFSEIGEFTVYECPICGGDSIFKHNYCSNCGQRLDWSEE